MRCNTDDIKFSVFLFSAFNKDIPVNHVKQELCKVIPSKTKECTIYSLTAAHNSVKLKMPAITLSLFCGGMQHDEQQSTNGNTGTRGRALALIEGQKLFKSVLAGKCAPSEAVAVSIMDNTIGKSSATAITTADEIPKISIDSTSNEPLDGEACNSILEGLGMFKVQ